MEKGAGKYDDEATLVRERVGAQTVVVIVLGGTRGSGFAVQSLDPDADRVLPALLRKVADEMDGGR